jgi:hypothetical protein
MKAKRDVPPKLQAPVTLDGAVRSVVRDELKRAGLAGSEPETPTSPTSLDLLVLGVVAADCALALVVYPAADNSAVQNFVKVMQWTGGPILVAAATWFPTRLLLVARRPTLRVVAIALLVLMLPQQVPLVPILVPRAAETVSEFKFDDRDSITKSSGRRLVTMSSHTVVTTSADQKCASTPQPTLTIAATELWSDIWRQRVVPIYYEAFANFPTEESEKVEKVLTISRRDGSFHSQEVVIVRKALAIRRTGRLRDDESASSRKMQIDVDGSTAGSQLRLANGPYILELLDTHNTCLGRLCGQLAKSLNGDCFLQFERAQCLQPCP